MDIDCPYCNKNTELDCDDLPKNACDDVLWECPECEREMKIGWRAEAEVRQVFNDQDFDDNLSALNEEGYLKYS